MVAALVAVLALAGMLPPAGGYGLNYTVGDLRRPSLESGGTACPQRNRFRVSPGQIDRRWSTSLGLSVLTKAASGEARLSEVEASILNSFAAWSSVSGTNLGPALGNLTRTTETAACSFGDGLNTMCFSQSDLAFQGGVLAFTRTVTSDIIGERIGTSAPSEFVGEILDADIYLLPTGGSSSARFATPPALPLNQTSTDLESVLTHEIGHMFGLGHSGVMRAIMFPFAPPPGQIAGERPTPQKRDAPLAEDDRTGLRVLYPDPQDTVHIGAIRGKVVPANPFSLSTQPQGVSGIFGAHVVAVDPTTGGVVAAALAGWLCTGEGPPVFDGSYVLERLPVGPDASYVLYVEPLDGPVSAASVSLSLSSPALCRNATTDPGWPQQFSCVVPAVNADFATRTRPSQP